MAVLKIKYGSFSCASSIKKCVWKMKNIFYFTVLLILISCYIIHTIYGHDMNIYGAITMIWTTESNTSLDYLD